MENQNVTRRNALRTIASGLIIGSSTVPASASGRSNTLSHQLDTVRSATREYRDIETARQAGYFPVSPYVPKMGFHSAKSSPLGENPPFGTDLEDPGVFMYFTNGSYNPHSGTQHDPTHDDDLILRAVEWLVNSNQEPDPPNIFADEDNPRGLKATEEEGWHYEKELDFTGLHAWVHRSNPTGVFHPTNPHID